jgi:hypothetical protein
MLRAAFSSVADDRARALLVVIFMKIMLHIATHVIDKHLLQDEDGIKNIDRSTAQFAVGATHVTFMREEPDNELY